MIIQGAEMYFLFPETKYECAKCGSRNYEEFSDPPKHTYSGHFEGIRCRECGHEYKTYVESIWETQFGSDTYSYSSNDVIKF
jgi:DNA-directed RNA polymerase subunit RPC12/RpoP